MSGWGCPHNRDGQCRRVPGRKCDPGMKGCVLHGKVAFSKQAKNSPRARRRLRAAEADRDRRRRPGGTNEASD